MQFPTVLAEMDTEAGHSFRMKTLPVCGLPGITGISTGRDHEGGQY
jgi:hypothetical protein